MRDGAQLGQVWQRWASARSVEKTRVSVPAACVVACGVLKLSFSLTRREQAPALQVCDLPMCKPRPIFRAVPHELRTARDHENPVCAAVTLRREPGFRFLSPRRKDARDSQGVLLCGLSGFARALPASRVALIFTAENAGAAEGCPTRLTGFSGLSGPSCYPVAIVASFLSRLPPKSEGSLKMQNGVEIQRQFWYNTQRRLRFGVSLGSVPASRNVQVETPL